ncbi:MAG: hypothetical protein E6929_18080 [Clostridium sp.]|nr:hypothetical protein [Clostridium sp.]
MMKHLRQRNINLLSEFTSYLLSIGCCDIHIDFKTENDTTYISFSSFNSTLTEKNIQKLTTLLETPRRQDVEEYYWELNGNENFYSELVLIGMMVDSSEVSYCDNILKVNLIRLT